MVPPSKDGLTECMVANQYWSGAATPCFRDMLPLQDSILVLESILLKDKDPNYPVFTVKVPRDVGFVTDAPADIFFIAYEDIFKLFHARRLDYNLVRLFALNLAMKIKRESTPDVAIADPTTCVKAKMPTYVVYKGRVPGVYEEWQDCLEQVHKFSGNSYKGYATREEAVAQWRAHVGKKKNRLKFLVPLLLTATAVVLYFTLV
ncbi:hypothetical protein QYE76_031026 [Lolium multiflorum]|uniref:Ribonuclease H1 N-terminal domain-containing protein n=1 Tax=Lolium multiflorum TaxID=4521 RepID=A0AAD8VJW6_LOLMU|nr:hypothetical protein QYE76_031026 [Lolium multiflorum]